MNQSREQILLATCDLLENQGFNATGLNQIVHESGAPKGSIYYYFPGGKEEIVAEEASAFHAGGPLTTVASESATTHDRINQVCREAYTGLRMAFAEKLNAGGVEGEQADSLSWIVLSIVEGAIILSRTFHSGDPLHQAARELGSLIKQYAQDRH